MLRSTLLLLALEVAGCSHPSPPRLLPAPVPATVPAPPSIPAAVTVKRVLIALGRPSGTSTETTERDGKITTTLDVHENGRGSHVDAAFRLAPDGTIATYEASGHHTFGATFHAVFEHTSTVATWKSDEETGQKAIAGKAFYLPIAETPELMPWLVRAAQKSGGTLELLPGGIAHVEKTGDVTVTVHGAPCRLTGYAISGLDLVPVQTWFNADGSWFGFASEWASLVPEGSEDAIEPLIVIQREITRARDAKLAQALAHHPPPTGLAYTHARVLDVERGNFESDQTVIVVGDRITAVGPSRSTRPPAGAEIVDLTGKALIPGMVDMHSHLGDADGVLDIASGVTTARDVGNDPDKLDDYQKRYDDGTAIGPHVLRFGFIEGRNEKASSSKITAETVEEAKAGVKFFVDRHYDGIKIYNSVRPELVPVITEEAHRAGLQVTGHVPVHMLANEAVRAGYDGIEHVNMLFLNFFATHDTDTRDTTRFTLVGDQAADFDLGGAKVREFFQLLLSHKTIIDPTVNAFEDLLVSEQGKIAHGLESMVARLPIQTQRGYLLGGLPLDPEKHQRYLASFEKLLEMTKALVDARVRVVIGTDALAGLAYQHELLLYARAGIPNAAILRMATLDPARYMGHDKTTGSIEPGKIADLVVIDGDPLAHLEDIRRTVTTMRGGVVYPAAPLYASVGVAPI